MNVLSVTNNAADQIKKILSSAPEGVDSVLVGIDKSGCSGYSYKLDLANSSELSEFDRINQHGVKILIDPKATMFLLGSTIDWKEEKFKQGFTFENPNETARCGCGESFSTN